jgi:hypothetical protein
MRREVCKDIVPGDARKAEVENDEIERMAPTAHRLP